MTPVPAGYFICFSVADRQLAVMKITAFSLYFYFIHTFHTGQSIIGYQGMIIQKYVASKPVISVSRLFAKRLAPILNSLLFSQFSPSVDFNMP